MAFVGNRGFQSAMAAAEEGCRRWLGEMEVRVWKRFKRENDEREERE